MNASTPATRSFFVTVPVADLDRSKAFFGALGLTFDPALSDDGGACLPAGR
ncbi:VOC family protein [Kineococcus sp. SYSU DK003]|uniref:VOC family protein n=1 Tax=Kineococcus sp. SYSU DK003 TaxID=3383124 RepID=UPI003D7EE989